MRRNANAVMDGRNILKGRANSIQRMNAASWCQQFRERGREEASAATEISPRRWTERAQFASSEQIDGFGESHVRGRSLGDLEPLEDTAPQGCARNAPSTYHQEISKWDFATCVMKCRDRARRCTNPRPARVCRPRVKRQHGHRATGIPAHFVIAGAATDLASTVYLNKTWRGPPGSTQGRRICASRRLSCSLLLFPLSQPRSKLDNCRLKLRRTLMVAPCPRLDAFKVDNPVMALS